MGLESHNFPEWPAAMDMETALAYTGVGERVLQEFERRHIVRFLPKGPNGRKITQRQQLDRMLDMLWDHDGALPPAEDMDFG